MIQARLIRSSSAISKSNRFPVVLPLLDCNSVISKPHYSKSFSTDSPVGPFVGSDDHIMCVINRKGNAFHQAQVHWLLASLVLIKKALCIKQYCKLWGFSLSQSCSDHKHVQWSAQVDRKNAELLVSPSASLCSDASLGEWVILVQRVIYKALKMSAIFLLLVQAEEDKRRGTRKLRGVFSGWEIHGVVDCKYLTKSIMSLHTHLCGKLCNLSEWF